MSDGQAILLTAAATAIGAALGAVASWYFSRKYYLTSGTDLDAALRPLAGNDQKLIQATNAIARMLEQAGIGKPSYDSADNLTGVVISGSAHITLPRLRVSGTGTVTGPPQYDRQHEQPEPEKPDGADA
jgi:hypothetical protein